MREAHKELRDDLRTDIGDLKHDTHRHFDELRAEFREGHAQTNRRIDDFRSTVAAILPRAAAESVDAPPPPGNRARGATVAAGASRR